MYTLIVGNARVAYKNLRSAAPSITYLIAVYRGMFGRLTPPGALQNVIAKSNSNEGKMLFKQILLKRNPSSVVDCGNRYVLSIHHNYDDSDGALRQCD